MTMTSYLSLVNAKLLIIKAFLYEILKSVFQGCQSGVRSLYATADLLAEVSVF